MDMQKDDKSKAAVLLVDPYNDFVSEGGKVWPRIKEVAEKTHTIENMKRVISAARSQNIKIFFVPHHRWEPGDYGDWKYPSPYQLASGKRESFAKGTWGGEFSKDFQVQKGDVIAKEHWASSGFANTDLDQQLRQHGIEKLIMVGMIANTCIESTAKFGMELGYHITLIKDATAAFSDEAMHAAHEINGPTYAHAIMTTNEFLESF